MSLLPENKNLKIVGLILITIACAVCGLAIWQLLHNRPPAAQPDTNGKQSVRQQPMPHPGLANQRKLFPDYRFVALYGTPSAPALGILGQQSVDDAVARAKDLVTNYQPYATEKIMPTFEIIATVASASPTENGDYSQEVSIDTIRPWIEAAQAAGIYVVLDLQPGRADFLTQAKQYEDLLKYDNVGLALDPEWRLAPGQVPLVQIGSVSIDEVNATIDWLAGVVKAHHGSQKLVVLHQFRTAMLPDRARLNTSHPELAYVIQMDGQGNQQVKQDTWRSITADAPANVQFGWKNFYHQDSPTLSPQETMQIVPKPWYVSYQ